jgi:hypothetical protein
MGGGMTEKEIKSLYYLSTFAWTFPATSAKQFLAFAFLDTTLFLVQRMRHDRNIRPYELRICDRCDWHTIQDEEHILLDCPHEHLVRLRTQQQLVVPPQWEDGPARLRTFMNQPDIFGVALPLL